MPNHPLTETLLTPGEIARILKISHRQVLRLPIPRLRISYKLIRYRQKDFEAYVATLA